ncbi:hypothetical protein RHSIM_Rhsim05G0147200 [Rhododendron simsii]|uniref:DUF4216 domain-containing protein n=1 Tax=Rhododendron simsii TaxID=118357 RepID=A0A834GZU3_RHOSS|nr:hypothetical protein RHSIM_Rhsim05G0147200 [Rhododendron simsii]
MQVERRRFDVHVKDEHFISVNASKTWYANEPFVLASQARQVYYLNDPKHGGSWQIVQKIRTRNLFDVLEVDKDDDNNNEVFQGDEVDVEVDGVPIQVEDREVTTLCREELVADTVDESDIVTGNCLDQRNLSVTDDEEDDTMADSIGLSKFVKGSCEIQKMTAYERARDEQIEKNLAMLESLGIKDLIASLPALYRSSTKKGTKKRTSKVAIGNDEEFLPPVGEESFGYSSDDSSGSQADKVKCTTRQKKKGGSGNRILRDSQRTREERHIIKGATSTPPTQPSTDHVEGTSVVAAQPTQLPCIATNNEVKGPVLLSFLGQSRGPILHSFHGHRALLSASFLSRKCNPVVELPTLVARLHGRRILFSWSKLMVHSCARL